MLLATAPRPEGGVEGVVEAMVLATTVSALHAVATAQHVALLALAALGAGVGAVEGRGEVRAGGGARTGAHLVGAELWTRQSCEAERTQVRSRHGARSVRSEWTYRRRSATSTGGW